MLLAEEVFALPLGEEAGVEVRVGGEGEWHGVRDLCWVVDNVGYRWGIG